MLYDEQIFSLDENIKRTYTMSGLKKAQRITVSLQNVEHAALSELAERHDVSLSWLTRQAIVEFLERHKQGELQLPLQLRK